MSGTVLTLLRHYLTESINKLAYYCYLYLTDEEAEAWEVQGLDFKLYVSNRSKF